MRLANWSLAFFVLGRLLIGAALGAAGVIQQPQLYRRFWQRLLQVTLPLGVALTGFVLLRDHGLCFADGWWKSPAARALSSVVRSASSIAMALAYMSIVVMLFQGRLRRLLDRFAPVGRMALTNYLAQSVIGIGVFYGAGLGLGPRAGMPGILLATALIFTLQTVLSHYWLRRFRFGPAEWLWRSLTYARWQPLRRTPAPATAGSG